MSGLSVFTVCDARYFPGLVALRESLRCHVPDAHLTVYDIGLADEQRAWLAPHTRVVDGRDERPVVPTLAKPFAARLAPSGPILIIDADGLVVGDLTPWIDRVRAGRIVASVDWKADRWVSEWSECFALRAPLRREPYVGAGTVMLDADRHAHLLNRWWEGCRRASAHYTDWRDAPANPIMHRDQDVLNALLMSEVPAGTVEHFAPGVVVADVFMPGIRLRDRERLRCTARGVPEPVVLQCVAPAKPFLPEGGAQLYGSAYTVALRAVLASEARRATPGSATAAERQVPWMRPGLRGAWAFRRRTVRIRVRKALGRWRARWLPHR